MTYMLKSIGLAVIGALMAACGVADKSATPSDSPAMIAPESVDALKTALAAALGRGKIELGADDPTTGPVVSVLPRATSALNDRDPLKPAVFDLVLQEGACVAISRSTGDRIALTGVTCRPLP